MDLEGLLGLEKKSIYFTSKLSNSRTTTGTNVTTVFMLQIILRESNQQIRSKALRELYE